MVPTPQSFLDNLENFLLATSIALEQVESNRDRFAQLATGAQTRQAEKLICQIRVLSVQLEKEFAVLEYMFTAGDSAFPQRQKIRFG